MPQQVVKAHQVVHVGMADEQGVNGAQGAFGQVMELPTVEQDAASGGPDMDEQHRVIEQAGEKAWLQVAKHTGTLHGGSLPLLPSIIDDSACDQCLRLSFDYQKDGG